MKRRILKKRLECSPKNKEYIESLPKVYLVTCWVRYGVLELPFSGKFKGNIPLVYDYRDYNGEHAEYVLCPIYDVTTGYSICYVFDENRAKRIADSLNKSIGA